jgi:hypothetical protein
MTVRMYDGDGKRATIVVYVNRDGLDDAVNHILDGSLRQHNPSLTVDASVHVLPVLDKAGVAHLPGVEDPYKNEGNNTA